MAHRLLLLNPAVANQKDHSSTAVCRTRGVVYCVHMRKSANVMQRTGFHRLVFCACLCRLFAQEGSNIQVLAASEKQMLAKDSCQLCSASPAIFFNARHAS